jgi:acyl-CoA synthetase (AMP-forming)/AMP-acid ligase II
MEWRSLAHLVEDAAQRFGEKPLFIFEDKPLSFAEVNRLANQTANALKSIGVDRGERVAVMQRRGFSHRLVCAGEVAGGHRASQHQLSRPRFDLHAG